MGITEFINKTNKGFKCIFKHRFSDFIVNEIDYNGNVVWLKRDISKDEIPEVAQENKEDVPEKKELTEEEVTKILKEKFTQFLSEGEIEALEKLVFTFINKQSNLSDTITVKFIDDKGKRKSFHEAIRENFPFLDSQTTENKETKEKSLIVSYMSKDSFKRRKIFPDNNKKVLIASVLKMNMDTVSAIGYISRMIHHSIKSIKFCGNKDKRGITTQRISMFNALPQEVIRATKLKCWSKYIFIDNFEFSESELRLGLLKGNQFCIMLRFVQTEGDTIENIIENVCKSVNEIGFINYFGMQRFGVSNVSTNKIGKYVIKKDWKQAYFHILATNSFYDACKQLNLEINSVEDIETKLFSMEDKEKLNSILRNLCKVINKFTTEHKLIGAYLKNADISKATL